jgi:hypothetical protein
MRLVVLFQILLLTNLAFAKNIMQGAMCTNIIFPCGKVHCSGREPFQMHKSKSLLPSSRDREADEKFK